MATAPQAGTAKKKTVVKTAPPSTSSTKVKTAAEPAATAKKAPAKTTAPTSAKPKSRGNGAGKSRQVSADQRRNYIEVAAYYIAERRGFIGGNVVDDWAAAEIEVDRLLTEGKLNG